MDSSRIRLEPFEMKPHSDEIIEPTAEPVTAPRENVPQRLAAFIAKRLTLAAGTSLVAVFIFARFSAEFSEQGKLQSFDRAVLAFCAAHRFEPLYQFAAWVSWPVAARRASRICRCRGHSPCFVASVQAAGRVAVAGVLQRGARNCRAEIYLSSPAPVGAVRCTGLLVSLRAHIYGGYRVWNTLLLACP